MKIPRRGPTERPARPPMTAMIDVVFLLLIYFVCTASLTPPEARLPSLLLPASVSAAGGDQDEDDPPRLIVEVPPQPQPLVADGQICATQAELAELLTAEADREDSRMVVLDVDRQTEFGRAIDVYDQCRLVGVGPIVFAVRVD